jgi:predicted nucleic acid-binding protein
MWTWTNTSTMSGANTGLEAVTGVLLDTSFILRLVKPGDALHQNVQAWFRELLGHNVPMYLSTIVVAEYCVKGDVGELPLTNLRLLPFNMVHAMRAGPFTATLLQQRKRDGAEDRTVVLNDVKLLAQAETSPPISHFLTKDLRFASRMQALRQGGHVLRTTVLDLNIPMADALGMLDFPE